MKTRLIIVALVLALVGCKNNRIDKPSKPENLLSQDQMVEVLYDMALLTSAKGLNRKVMENKGIVPRSYVFEKHNIDSMQFALSNEYYAYRIKDYEAIYQRVKAKLEADQERFTEEVNAERTKEDVIQISNKRRRDSIIDAKTKDLELDRQ